MRLFLLNLCKFSLVQLLLWTAVLLVYTKQKPFDADFNATTRDKQLLLENEPSPRIILVGGSNLIFGINSPEIERRTAYHPVNMGLNVGDGLAFMLSNVEPWLRPGDIVIVSPEYEMFGDFYNGLGPFLYAEAEHSPAVIRRFTRGNLLEVTNKGFIIAGGIFRYTVQQKGKTERQWIENKSHVFRRDAFNRYGDLVDHYSLPNRLKEGFTTTILIDARATPRTISRAIEGLNRFGDAAARRGARVFYSFPPLPVDLFEKQRPATQQIEAALQKQLRFPILDTPGEITFPTDHFFDAYYHLTAEGAMKRTARLLDRLEERGINKTPSAAKPQP
jgi:hypothetical protein